MNKVMICIEILQLLSGKDLLNVNEIADYIEINPRNVKEYIKTLQNCGYDIVSVRGRYGGYRLNKDSLIPAIGLNQEEIDIIKSSSSYLEKQNDFLNYKGFVKAISKVLSCNYEGSDEQITIIDRYPLLISREELLKRYECFKKAINSNNKCKITYMSIKDKYKEHIIHPYKIFIFSESWFILAWNETVNDFGYFKMNRISKFEILKDKFTILKTFSLSNYLDEFGMKQNGKYYDIKLLLIDLYTVVSERRYGKNQKITRLDEHRTILECSMQNKNNIKTFVLSFGKKAIVLEPEWLKEMIMDEAQSILNNK